MAICSADPVAVTTPVMREWLAGRFGEWWRDGAAFPEAEVHRSIDYRYPDDTTRLAAGNWLARAPERLFVAPVFPREFLEGTY